MTFRVEVTDTFPNGRVGMGSDFLDLLTLTSYSVMYLGDGKVELMFVNSQAGTCIRGTARDGSRTDVTLKELESRLAMIEYQKGRMFAAEWKPDDLNLTVVTLILRKSHPRVVDDRRNRFMIKVEGSISRSHVIDVDTTKSVH